MSRRIAAMLVAVTVALISFGAIVDDGVWVDVPEPTGAPVQTIAVPARVPATINEPVHPHTPAVRVTTTVSSPTTTTPPTTSTSVVIPPASARCPQWWQLALDIGWPEWALPILDYLMDRESKCDPSQRSTTRDTGLLQLNDVHLSWLAAHGITQQALYDPATNLRAALLLFGIAQDIYGCGWQPWTTDAWSPC